MDTEPNEPTNQKSIKVPKFVKQTNKKTLIYYKILGISVKKTVQCPLPSWNIVFEFNIFLC